MADTIIPAIPATKAEGMSTGVKILLAGSLIIVIAAAVYFGTKSPTKGPTKQLEGGGATSPTGGGLSYTPATTSKTSPAAAANGFPLNSGSSGPLVKDIQNGLNQSVNAGLTVDGQFGPLTLAAVKKAGFTVPIQQDEYNVIKAGQTAGNIMSTLSSAFSMLADGSGVSTYSRNPLTYPPATGIVKEYGLNFRNDA